MSEILQGKFIEMRHGAGGEETDEIIGRIFAEAYGNPVLAAMEDGAVLPPIDGSPVFTSDTFVIQPVEFPGGDIGRLCVCGTVNDLAAMGAKPLYLTTSFILETGLELSKLKSVAESLAATAKEAGVMVVAGDTKVIEGNGGVMINTAGIGVRTADCHISVKNVRPGDSLIITGNLGEHHCAVMNSRLGIESSIKSDCAPLNNLVEALLQNGMDVHTIRDITRGGLSTVSNEIAKASRCGLVFDEEKLPVGEDVASVCGILGLDPWNLANEGKLFLAVAAEDAEKCIEILRQEKYGTHAVIVGTAVSEAEHKGVYLETSIGTLRKVLPLRGEGLPRIC